MTERRKRSTTIGAVLIGGLLLGSCANVVGGAPVVDTAQQAPAGKPWSYTPSDFPIEFAMDDGGSGAAADQIARDSLDDINAFYSSWYPDVFGHDFEPLEGGYYSIGPDEGNASPCMDGADDPVIENNAFYCAFDDEVVYWRPLLERYADEYSDMQVGLVLAHELGHAIQKREDVTDVRSIVAETQADCFAGTWARSVADDKDPHFAFDPVNLDQTLLAWAIELPSEVGSDPNDTLQHGSAFDRVSAFQEGYEQGPQACKDNFNDSRLYTQMEFTDDNGSDDGQGNADYTTSVTIGQRLFDEFFADRFPDLNGSWTNPKLLLGGSGEASCPADEVISYCAANNAVVISDEQSFRQVHDDYGDFAVVTAMGLAYSEAAIIELGFSTDDPQAMTAASCLTGAAASAVIPTPNDYKVVLSPGDFDEATVMLLTADADNPIVDTGGGTAFARMDAFRNGVSGGVGNCGITG